MSLGFPSRLKYVLTVRSSNDVIRDKKKREVTMFAREISQRHLRSRKYFRVQLLSHQDPRRRDKEGKFHGPRGWFLAEDKSVSDGTSGAAANYSRTAL